MLKKLNTALRLLVVGLLIYPFPIAIAQEVTVNEGLMMLIGETTLLLQEKMVIHITLFMRKTVTMEHKVTF